MIQFDGRCQMSLSLSGQKLGRTQKGSAFQHLPSLRRSLRRSGRSPALPYPPHECQECITRFYPPLKKGTSLLCKLGDISTSH
jgi:hypothetical protein